MHKVGRIERKISQVILAILYIYKENNVTKNNSFSIIDIELFSF